MFIRVLRNSSPAALALSLLFTPNIFAQDAQGPALQLIPAQGAKTADALPAAMLPDARLQADAEPQVARRLETARIIPILPPLALSELANRDVAAQDATAANPSDELRDRLRAVLTNFHDRRLNSGENSPWQIMHRVVAYGVDTQIEVGRPGGPQQPAIGWLLFNQPFRGQRILSARQNGVYGVEGAGVQGHAGQLLAILAQSRLQRDYPIRVGSQEFTVEDLIRSEQLTCRSGTELTFKLIGLSHYLPSDATWKSADGQSWSIERLVREEIAQRIQGGTCGGTHRLMGLTYAVVARKRQGLEITGDFDRAATYINEYIDYAMKLRNPDGSFSTSFLERRAADPDLGTRLRTSGHVLEWLVFAVSDDVLREPEIVQSVEYLTQLLEQSPDRAWEIGPLGHALHALAIYNERVWGEAPRASSETASQAEGGNVLFGSPR